MNRQPTNAIDEPGISTICLAAVPFFALLHATAFSFRAVWISGLFAAGFVVLERRWISAWIMRTSMALLAITAILLPFADTPIASLERGTRIGTLIASLILAVNLLSQAASRIGRVRDVMSLLFSLPSRHRYVSLSVASQFFGGMLGLAGITMLMEMASRDKYALQEERVATFAAITRGFAAATLWSPMYSNISIMIALYRDAEWATVLPLAMLMALTLILIGAGLKAFGQRQDASNSPSPSVHSLHRLAYQSVAIVAAMGFFLTFILVTSLTTGIQVTAVIIAMSPIVAWLLNISVSTGRSRVGAGSRRLIQDVKNLKPMAGEVLLFLVSGAAGTVIADAVPRTWTAPVGDALAPYPVVACLFLMSLIILISCAAVHPLLSALLVAACFPREVMSLPLLPHLCAILVGWAMAAILTPFSIVSLMASRYSGVPVLTISLRSNRLFALASVLASSLILGGVAAYVQY